MNIVKVSGKAIVKSVIEKMNSNNVRIIFVIDEKEKFLGLITGIAIRKNILNGISLETQICEIMNKNPIVIYDYWTEKDIIQYLNSQEIIKEYPKFKPLIVPLIVPVLSKDEKIIYQSSLFPFNLLRA